MKQLYATKKWYSYNYCDRVFRKIVFVGELYRDNRILQSTVSDLLIFSGKAINRGFSQLHL